MQEEISTFIDRKKICFMYTEKIFNNKIEKDKNIER